MAGTLNSLQHYKEEIQRSHVFHDPVEHKSVVVLAIHRYMLDPDFPKHSGIATENYIEAFDVTITDSSYKMKCLLDLHLNSLVQTNQLAVGCKILIKDCMVRYNESDIYMDSFVIIRDVEVLCSEDNEVILNSDRILWCLSSSEKERQDVPLVTTRGHYLPLWNDNDPCTSIWDNLVPASDEELQSTARVTIQQLSQSWKTIYRPYPALIVCILHRSRLRHYGKVYKTDKWPYQAYLMVADRTGVCTAVMWNNLCPHFYKSLPVGTVLLLKNYTVRERFQLMTKPTLRYEGLPTYDLELNLNKSNPETELILIHPNRVRQEWILPPPRYHFCNRLQLGSLPNQYNCDVAGVITFVGRCERERKIGPGGHDNKAFWLRRWIHIMDGTSPQPIRLYLFETSQPEVHNSLLPGKLLVCTQMRLIHNLHKLQSSRQQRALYLTTTNESQLYTEGHTTAPYRDCQAVQDVMGWSRGTDAQGLLQTSIVGGYYHYPPLPSTLDDYMAQLPKNQKLKVIVSDSLQHELSHMVFRESRSITVQGLIVHVQYITVSKSYNSTTSRKTGLRSRQVSSETPTETKRAGSGATSEDSLSLQQADRVTEKSVFPGKVTLECLVEPSWPHMQDQVQLLGMSHPHVHFFKHRFSTEQEDLLQEEFSMPECVYWGNRLQGHIKDLPSTDTAYFRVTILGLNQKVAVLTLLPVPMEISQNAVFGDLLNGLATERNAGPMQRTSKNVVKRLIDSSQDLQNRRMVFILDVYSYETQQEVVLNRGYLPTTGGRLNDD